MNDLSRTGQTGTPYPLSHWASREQVIPDDLREAIHTALNQSAQVASGSVSLLSDAGNHSVYRVDFSGRSYCLKQPRPSSRHGGDPEVVLRREVGGLCVLSDRVPGFGPNPYSWSTDPPWVLMELLPGDHLGNVSLNDRQVAELAASYHELCSIRPALIAEPLWVVDWNCAFLVQWLHDRLPLMEDAAKQDDSIAEAVSLVRRWLASSDPEAFLGDSDLVFFSRGDSNLANALWDDGRLRFVDFEYCGWSDLPRDISLVTDHVQSYATPIESWNEFVAHFDLSRNQHRRLLAGRRRQALSWLAKECLSPGSLRGLPDGERFQIVLERARRLMEQSHS